ncbi:MAG TPA: hypothetical protein VFN87_07250 [Solirubrobacteraceae bacterium]|nr:hypothetical protein [Solirubrobacteraceae bacterium]
MLRRALMLAAVAVLCAAGASAALAARPSPSNPAGKMLGVVPSRHAAGHNRSGGSNLSYHNGPVMHTNTVYAIYWEPPGFSAQTGYESLINRFFGDVAAASGATSNVYYSDTQYYDTTGSIAYRSSFAGSVVDTDPLPASGCSDSYTSVCLTDSQIQAEITHVIKANGWTANSSTEFFMFTAKGIGSCDGSSCAFSQYCAYHSWIGSGSTATIYANMPYADTVPSACDAGQHPNNNDADATINVTSHEHNESITDEQGSAWYDSRGYENGDKCAWNFGATLGSTAYGQYNQLINGDPYYLQQEWSDHSSGCVLRGT